MGTPHTQSLCYMYMYVVHIYMYRATCIYEVHIIYMYLHVAMLTVHTVPVLHACMR